MLTHVLYKQVNHNNYYVCNINLYNKYTLNNNTYQLYKNSPLLYIPPQISVSSLSLVNTQLTQLQQTLHIIASSVLFFTLF